MDLAVKEKHLEILALAARVGVGGLLIVAGASKISDAAGLVEIIANYRILPVQLVSLAAVYLPWLELVVGMSLILGLLVQANALIAAGMSFSFALAVSSAVIRGLDVECGCFSGASKVSWGHVGIDALLFFASLYLVYAGETRWRLETVWSRQPAGTANLRSAKWWASVAMVMLLGNAITLIYIGQRATRSGLTSEITTSETAEALISFELPVLDLGTVQQGSEIARKVAYRNSSNKRLNILQVETSCGCTVPTITKRDLEPEESGEMTVVYTPGTSQGNVQNWIRFHLADEVETPELVARANVTLLLEPSPGLLKLNRVGETKKVTIRAVPPNLKFEITDIQPPTSALTVSLLGYPEPGVAEIEVRLVSLLPPPREPATAWVIPIQTDLSSAPPVMVYVQGDVAK